MSLLFRLSGLAAAASVVLSYSPVNAVFSLVLVFCATSARRIRLQREFRGLVFLRVYVGAIAVLFLFVVRRLNVQPQPAQRLAADRRANRPRLLLVALLFLLQRDAVLYRGLGSSFHPSLRAGEALEGYVQWISVLDGRNEREALGQVLYSHYFVLFLTAGLVLLVSRVGAVALVRSIPTGGAVGPRRQQVHQQLSRDAARAVFLTREA